MKKTFKCTLTMPPLAPKEITKPGLKFYLLAGFKMGEPDFKGRVSWYTYTIEREMTYAEIKRLHGKNGFFSFKTRLFRQDITLSILKGLPDKTELTIEL